MREEVNMHYVCTRDEAWQLVKNRDTFWVSNCGCREQRGSCRRSRIDVCLDFYQQSSSRGSGMKQVTLDDVKDIFTEAQDKHLVTRPFRNSNNSAKIDGICFCCDDCCGYFLDPSEECDKGDSIATTDMDTCNSCGVCVDVCYFGAREIYNDKLVIKQNLCYGCGLCLDVCPEACISMVKR